MESYLCTLSVPAIAAAVYFVVWLIRHAVGKNAKFERFVPLLSAGLGVVFGVVCFFALPSIIPADNVVVAIVIGAASGFTAIGTGQMFKQLNAKGTQDTPSSPTDSQTDVSEPPSTDDTDTASTDTATDGNNDTPPDKQS